jgi:hypothetical protein
MIHQINRRETTNNFKVISTHKHNSHNNNTRVEDNDTHKNSHFLPLNPNSSNSQNLLLPNLLSKSNSHSIIQPHHKPPIKKTLDNNRTRNNTTNSIITIDSSQNSHHNNSINCLNNLPKHREEVAIIIITHKITNSLIVIIEKITDTSIIKAISSTHPNSNMTNPNMIIHVVVGQVQVEVESNSIEIRVVSIHTLKMMKIITNKHSSMPIRDLPEVGITLKDNLKVLSISGSNNLSLVRWKCYQALSLN